MKIHNYSSFVRNVNENRIVSQRNKKVYNSRNRYSRYRRINENMSKSVSFLKDRVLYLKAAFELGKIGSGSERNLSFDGILKYLYDRNFDVGDFYTDRQISEKVGDYKAIINNNVERFVINSIYEEYKIPRIDDGAKRYITQIINDIKQGRIDYSQEYEEDSNFPFTKEFIIDSVNKFNELREEFPDSINEFEKMLSSSDKLVEIVSLCKSPFTDLVYPFFYMYVVEDITYNELSELFAKILIFRNKIRSAPIELYTVSGVVKRNLDVNFIDEGRRDNYELLWSAIELFEEDRNANQALNSLPLDIKNALPNEPNEFLRFKENVNRLRKLIDKASTKDMKDKIWNGLFGNIKWDEDKNKYVYTSDLLTYFEQIRKGASVGVLVNKIDSYVSNLEGSFPEKLKLIKDLESKGGTKVLFADRGIIVVEVYDVDSNIALNQHTRHCIKNASQWRDYVTITNKQIYIYNFNIPQTEDLSTIGVTVYPDGKYRKPACQDKSNNYLGKILNDILKRWRSEYKIGVNLLKYLEPKTLDEVNPRNKEEAMQVLEEFNDIDLETMEEYVEDFGIDINFKSNILIKTFIEKLNINAVISCLELGSYFSFEFFNSLTRENLTGKYYEMFIKVYEYLKNNRPGQEYNIPTRFISVIPSSDEQWLDIFDKVDLDDLNFENNKLVKEVLLGSWTSPDNNGQAYINSLIKLFDKGVNFKNKYGEYHVLNLAAGYGRIDALEYLFNSPISREFTKKHLEEAIDWAETSQHINKATIDKTVEFISNEIKKR